MNKSLEELKQIVEGAPDGATHYEELSGIAYWDFDVFKLYLLSEREWEEQYAGIRPDKSLSSLSDLHRIIKLEEEKMELMCTFEREIKNLAKNYVSMSNDVFSGVYSNKTPEGSIINEQNFVDASYENILDPIFISHKQSVSDMISSSKKELEEENQRLREQIKEMSELCLTTGEVNKIKADAIRGALKHLDNKQRFSNKFLTGRQVLEDYAKNLEGEAS